jgi:hypothetical protein
MMQHTPELGQTRDEVDLSPAAIDQRLDEVGQLYELGLYLAQATPWLNSAAPVERPAGDE